MKMFGADPGAIKNARFFAIIMDRSKCGSEALKHVSEEFPDLAAKNVLREGLDWEFLIYLRSLYHEGSMVAMAKDAGMLSQALEAVSAKVTDLGGGYCAYIPAVSEESEAAVVEIIGKMQPSVGSKNN